MSSARTTLRDLEHGEVRSEQILVIDIDPTSRAQTSATLHTAGYAVETAPSTDAGLAALQRGKPSLVLLDIDPGNADALEALRRIREAHPHLPVVVTAGATSIGSALEATQLAAHDFLIKPLEGGRLRLVVKNALEVVQLSQEVNQLRRELKSRRTHANEIVGADAGLREAMLLLEKVIPTDLAVLVQGESGTGKELFARALHEEGPRSAKPFVVVNCASLPESLLETELFGVEKNALGSGDDARPGKLEAADGGTLLLDEVGEMSAAVQGKLLRALQDRAVVRVGGNNPIAVDVRLICTTQRDLGRLVAEQKFRQDLYYRLSVFPLTIPALRERREDIPALVRHFLARANPAHPPHVHPTTMDLLERYGWPGNVRELQNVLRRALVLAGNETLRPEHLPAQVQAVMSDTLAPLPATAGLSFLPLAAVSDALPTLDEIERLAILRALEVHRGNISQVSRTLAIGRTTLYRKLQRYGIQAAAER